MTQLQLLAQRYRVGLLIIESQFLTRLVTRFENLDFMKNLLFPLLKNFKSVVDERGHCLRSESPFTFLPGAAPKCYLLNAFKMIHKEMSTQANLKTQELTANYYENYENTYTCFKSGLAYIHCYVTHNMQLPLYKFLFENKALGTKR